MNLTIVADENMAGVQSTFGDMGRIRLVKGRDLQREDLLKADVLLVRSVTKVDEALLGGTAVQFVGTATSGFDHIDRSYLASRDISFAHAPGSNANSVVEYVLGAIGEVDHKLEHLFTGGTLGIVGYGNIGSLLAARLSALNIRFKVYDPWLNVTDIENPASLEEVLACDVISLHAELSQKSPWPSYHLLGEHELAQIDTTALLINASRGPVVDNAALKKRLQAGAGPRCILDVWEGEPEISQELLSRVEFGSAHIAGYSLDGKLLATRILREALDNSCSKSGSSLDENSDEARAVSLPPIILPDNLSGADLFRSLLHHNYQLAEDDRLLREAVVGKSATQARENFDRLRKQYRVRREVYGAEVDVCLSSDSDRRLLEAMGCLLKRKNLGEA